MDSKTSVRRAMQIEIFKKSADNLKNQVSQTKNVETHKINGKEWPEAIDVKRSSSENRLRSGKILEKRREINNNSSMSNPSSTNVNKDSSKKIARFVNFFEAI